MSRLRRLLTWTVVGPALLPAMLAGGLAVAVGVGAHQRQAALRWEASMRACVAATLPLEQDLGTALAHAAELRWRVQGLERLVEQQSYDLARAAARARAK